VRRRVVLAQVAAPDTKSVVLNAPPDAEERVHLREEIRRLHIQERGRSEKKQKLKCADTPARRRVRSLAKEKRCAACIQEREQRRKQRENQAGKTMETLR
jgi:hypothetical protein